MTCDITNTLKVNQGPIFSIHNFCNVENVSLQCTNMENGLYGDKEDVLCPAVKHVK